MRTGRSQPGLTAGDKPLIILHGEIKSPPMSSSARTEAGYNLRQVQQGENPQWPLSKPMPEIGAGCHELRISDTELHVEWRIMYFVDDVAIVVLEVWKKDTPKTPERIKKACRERLQRYSAAKRGT
jgi:phage-related protein